MTTSVFQPAVLLAVPYLMLVGFRGVRGASVLLATVLAGLVAISGSRDSFWYVERAWALLLGGWFVAVRLYRPGWRFAPSGLAAVLGATASAAGLLSLRSASVQPGAWEALDWSVTQRIQGSIDVFLDAATVLREGQPLAPAMVTAFYEAAEAQINFFPALTGIGSLAALAIVWWAYRAFSGDTEQALGPVADYRFNDHLVWVFIGGLLLLFTRWSEPASRAGSNLVLFMGALYALRGAGVVMFVSGGLSWFGYAMTVLGFLLMPPVAIGAALVIGIGDTWLNVRGKIAEIKA